MENDDLAEAAKTLYDEPTIFETEDKCLPNGQQPYSLPEGFTAHIAHRQAMQENGIEIGLI